MKTVIEMAREAGAGEPESLYGRTDYVVMTKFELERFAEIVRADEREKWEGQTAVEVHEAILDEREACAEAADDQWVRNPNVSGGDAIRSRSSEH